MPPAPRAQIRSIQFGPLNISPLYGPELDPFLIFAFILREIGFFSSRGVRGKRRGQEYATAVKKDHKFHSCDPIGIPTKGLASF